MANANITAVITADDRASRKLKGFGDNVASTAKKAGLALAAAGAGLTLFAKNATDFTTEYVKGTKQIARETGLTTKASSRLLFVGQRLGLSADDLSRSFGIFSKSLVKAGKDSNENSKEQTKLKNQIEKTKIEIRETNKEIVKNGDETGKLANKVEGLKIKLQGLEGDLKNNEDAFSKLGIKVKDANGNIKPFNAILSQTADKFQKMQDGPRKTALAMELFGRSGKDMIKVLNLGSDGIAKLSKKADELGFTLSSRNIGAFNKYIESQKDLADSTNALKIRIGTLTAPVLTAFNQKLNDTLTTVLKTDSAFSRAAASTLAFGGPILTAGGGLVAFGASLAQVIQGLRASGVALKSFTLGFGIIAFVTASMISLANSVQNVSMRTGEAKSGYNSWQGILLSMIPVIGANTSTIYANVGALRNAKYAADQLKQAEQSLIEVSRSATSAHDTYRQAKIDMISANLAVKRAEIDLKDAVSRYGRGSLEAKEATVRLKSAKLEAARASGRGADALRAYKKELDRLTPANKAAEIRGLARAMTILSSGAYSARDAIKALNAAASAAPTKISQPKRGDPGLTFSKRSGGPVRARGGVFTRVGEEGPENLILPSGSRVERNIDSKLGGGSSPNIHIHVGAFMGTPNDARKMAKLVFKAFQDYASQSGMAPSQILDGAVGTRIR